MTRSGERQRVPPGERGPLRVLFLSTSLPVGGAETLLVNLIRHLDRAQFAPELCCLKQLGPLGEPLRRDIPTYARLLAGKYDLRVLPRLVRLLCRRQIDAVVTVGAGDKMFWGRLAARLAGVPVVVSALHSTGWPDRVGRLNRMLTPLTDTFVAVAQAHGRYLTQKEGFPAEKVRVIPNGVDTEQFRWCGASRRRLRQQLGIEPRAPVCGIVAALRPEKNHRLFLRAAALTSRQLPDAHFLVVGDGPERKGLEAVALDKGLGPRVHFLGSRADVPDVLSTLDVFALTSHNEANPVSILEAMSVGLPVVSTRVGSVAETVVHGVTGLLARPGAAAEMAAYWTALLGDLRMRVAMGRAGRQRVVTHWSLGQMVGGYQDLIMAIYNRKCRPPARGGGRQCRVEPDEVAAHA